MSTHSKTKPQIIIWLRRIFVGLKTMMKPPGNGHSNLPSVTPSHPLDNIRVMVIVWRLRGNIIRTALWFDTVGLVIWAVKIVTKIIYYVSSGTLNPTHSLTPSVTRPITILTTILVKELFSGTQNTLKCTYFNVEFRLFGGGRGQNGNPNPHYG